VKVLSHCSWEYSSAAAGDSQILDIARARVVVAVDASLLLLRWSHESRHNQGVNVLCCREPCVVASCRRIAVLAFHSLELLTVPQTIAGLASDMGRPGMSMVYFCLLRHVGEHGVCGPPTTTAETVMCAMATHSCLPTPFEMSRFSPSTRAAQHIVPPSGPPSMNKKARRSSPNSTNPRIPAT
jgi:hypothetical protein